MNLKWKDLDKWDQRFLDLAKHISTWSKDPSTQVGAVIANDKEIVSLGYNGYPMYIKDEESNDTRDKKLSKIVHAEINAILFARTNLLGFTLYTYPFMPCNNCMSIVIQAGIMRVVAPYSYADRWQESFAISRELCRKSDTELLEINMLPEHDIGSRD